MTLFAPRTWVHGEFVTAAIMNTALKDDFDELYSRVPYGGLAIGNTSTNYYVQGGLSPSDDLMPQNEMWLSPMWVPKATTLDRIGLRVLILAASSAVRLGIYRDNGTFKPGTLLLDAGTIDSTTTGNKEITISQAVPFGTWWLAAVRQGTGSPDMQTIDFDEAGWMVGSAVENGLGHPTDHETAFFDALANYKVAGVSGALPASADGAGIVTGNHPCLRWYVRVA